MAEAAEQQEGRAGMLPARRILAVILVLGVGMRLWLVFTAAGINSDAFLYALTAQRMADRGVVSGMRGDFVWPYQPVNAQLVVYQFLGSLLYRLTGDAILSLRLVSAISGSVLILVVYLVAMQLFKKEAIALLSAGLIAFHPEFARASASVYREVLMALLLAVAFLAVLWAFRRGRAWPFCAVAAGITLFAAFLTRPDGAAAAVGIGLVALFLVPAVAWKKRLTICLIMGLTFSALEVPYVVWMKKTTGYWLISQWQVHRVLPKAESVRQFLLRSHRFSDERAE